MVFSEDNKMLSRDPMKSMFAYNYVSSEDNKLLSRGQMKLVNVNAIY